MSAFLAKKHRVSGLGALHYTSSIPSLLLLSCAPHWPSSSCSMVWHPIVQSDSTHLPFLSSAMLVVSDMTLYLPLSTFHFWRELGDTLELWTGWQYPFSCLWCFPALWSGSHHCPRTSWCNTWPSVVFRSSKLSVGWKKESEIFAEVKLRAGTSLWWLHHKTETWNLSFIGHCKSVTSLASSQILLATLLQEISLPFPLMAPVGFLSWISQWHWGIFHLGAWRLHSPDLSLAAGFLSHLCWQGPQSEQKAEEEQITFPPIFISAQLSPADNCIASASSVSCVSQAMASVLVNLLCQLEWM